MSEELDLDDDLTALKGLSPTVLAAPSDEGNPLADDWKTLRGVPDFGYVVRGGQHSLDDAILWRVQFFSASTKGPGWAGSYRNGLWVTYEYVECLWHGPSANTNPAVTTKDGRVIRRYRGDFASFDLTLLDAVCKLRQIRDRLVTMYRGDVQRLRQNAQQMLLDADRYEQKVVDLRAWNPEDEVPPDLLEAEDMALEAALAELE